MQSRLCEFKRYIEVFVVCGIRFKEQQRGSIRDGSERSEDQREIEVCVVGESAEGAERRQKERGHECKEKEMKPSEVTEGEEGGGRREEGRQQVRGGQIEKREDLKIK